MSNQETCPTCKHAVHTSICIGCPCPEGGGPMQFSIGVGGMIVARAVDIDAAVLEAVKGSPADNIDMLCGSLFGYCSERNCTEHSGCSHIKSVRRSLRRLRERGLVRYDRKKGWGEA